jgi:hypothetical protein
MLLYGFNLLYERLGEGQAKERFRTNLMKTFHFVAHVLKVHVA